jgi:hypothetical protein
MRRHVLRVCGVGSDLGVEPRCIEAFLGDRRIVVKVNQVVRHARMLRLAHEDRIQDRCSFELIGVGFVSRRGRGVERQCVVDLCLVVVRIALRQLLHRFGIGLDARAMIDLFVIGIHDRKSVDIIALTVGLCSDTLSLLYRGGTLGEILGRRRHVRIPQKAQGNAPVANAAIRVGLQGIFKYFLRRAVPE